MRYKYSLCILFSLLFTLSAHAQSATPDPIDVEYHACVGKDTSTGNICNCAFTAYDKWNHEMSKTYSRLLKTLKKDKDKTALKQSQTLWMAYRDGEFKSYDNMFNIPGSKWCLQRQNSRIDVVRTRALQLDSYLEALRNR
jgi:uncharacterized protein YecT (DUF1311 family)